MSNRGAQLSKAIRQRAKWSQQVLADRLFVSRNYIALIESGKKTPSVRLLSQLESLWGDVEKGNTEGVQETIAVVTHGAKKGSVTHMQAEAGVLFSTVLKQAGENPERLSWLLEQLRSHLVQPHHWSRQDEDQRHAAKLEALKQQVAAQGKPGLPSDEAADHKAL